MRTTASEQQLLVVKSIGDHLQSLKLGSHGPLNPSERLALAQRNYETAVATFNANQTPANAMAVQKVAQVYLEAAQRVWARSSPEYAGIFNGVVDRLKTLQADAAARGASIDAEITRLRESQEKPQKTVQEIRDQAQRDIEAERRQMDQTVATIHATAQAQIDAVKQDLGEVMRAIAQARYALLLCPVCFFPDLEQPPRDFSICPCCGTEFGVDDYSPRGISSEVIYRELRWEWLERGGPWFDPETPQPNGWNGFEQIWNSPYWLRTAVSTAAPTRRMIVAPKGNVVDARVLAYA